MTEKDLRPTRYLLTIRYCQDFVTEFFEQNPISQIGIIGMRDGIAVRVSDMSGNPSDHISNLQALRAEDPKGQPSLQNALDMARASLLYVVRGLLCYHDADRSKAMHHPMGLVRFYSFSAPSSRPTLETSTPPLLPW